MRRRTFPTWPVMILITALAVRLLTALPMRQPGFMDAHYYYVGALNLIEGRGFNDPYLWNYLDDPAGVPHPSHLYWMPLPSLVAWAGMALLGASYRAGQWGFILLSSLLPLVSYAVARQVSGKRRHAVLAALVTIFGGFYLPFWVSTESAAPFALFGSLTLLALGLGLKSRRAGWFAAAGAAAGLAYLTRSDGLLLLLVALVTPLFAMRQGTRFTFHVSRIIPFLITFLLITAPWLYRNWQAIGALQPPGGLQSLWFRDYSDLYSYGQTFTPQTYLDWGWANILRAKLHVAASNLLRVIAEDGLIFLFPFALIGLWSLRRERLYWPFLLYAPLLWMTMTFAFTYPGWLGGLLHSSAAWLPFVFPAAMVGLDTSIEWAAQHLPHWQPQRAGPVFGALTVLLAALLSGTIYWQAVLGDSLDDPAWNRSDLIYHQVDAWLDNHAAPDDLVMVNNPPSFYYHTGRSGVVVPAEGPQTLLEICDRYAVRYVVLDHNIVPQLQPLYNGELTLSRLVEQTRLGGEHPVIIFQVDRASP
ncbi:MAG: glycosyltransferase family 39 protein [Chloroflexota bacterium]